MQFQAVCRITQNYAGITQNYTCFTQISYAGIKQILRKIRTSYANKLRRHYAMFTHKLRKNDHAQYAGITQICLRINYAYFQFLRNYITQILRRYYANKLRNSLRRLRNSITQIRLRNSPKCHYADYANTDFHYAKIQFITQWATC